METAKQSKRKKRASVSPLPLKVSSLALTQTEADMLAALCQDAGDDIGRSISGSAVVRALIRLAGHRATELTVLVREIEEELNAGRKWGHDSSKPRA